jgi:hypothetical protein
MHVVPDLGLLRVVVQGHQQYRQWLGQVQTQGRVVDLQTQMQPQLDAVIALVVEAMLGV